MFGCKGQLLVISYTACAAVTLLMRKKYAILVMSFLFDQGSLDIRGTYIMCSEGHMIHISGELFVLQMIAIVVE